MPDAHERDTIAAAYRNANASLAIEGLHMTADDLALQQRVVDGEWTHDDFRARVIAESREREYRRAIAQETVASITGADGSCREDADRYIRGELTLGELAAIVRARCDRQGTPS